jgi:hypothetical protein
VATAASDSKGRQLERAAACSPDGVLGAAPPTVRVSLRKTAAALLAAWDNQECQQHGLPEAMEQLRALLTSKPVRTPRDTGSPRKPCEGTKLRAVLAMLRCEEGPTVAQIAQATGWASHTVDGFLAGLKKDVQGTTLERAAWSVPIRKG